MAQALEAKCLGMPICRFCGKEAEEGRHPNPGWHCNFCYRWQNRCAAVCSECGERVAHDRVNPPPLIYKLD
jgi:hypothetical protein